MAHTIFGRKPVLATSRFAPMPSTGRKDSPESLRHNEL